MIYNFNHETMALSSVLGTGTYGVVKLGGTSLTRAFYAVKMAKAFEDHALPEEVASAQGKTVFGEQDLVKEKSMLLGFKHPCIVACYGIVTRAKTIGLVLELCHGTLAQWLRQNPPLGPSREFRVRHQVERDRFLLQLASAVQYIHEQKVVHLDLKSNNCLLASAGGSASVNSWLVKLSDFGLSCRCPPSGLVVMGRSVYNAGYRPPELDVNGKARL